MGPLSKPHKTNSQLTTVDERVCVYHQVYALAKHLSASLYKVCIQLRIWSTLGSKRKCVISMHAYLRQTQSTPLSVCVCVCVCTKASDEF